MLKQLLKTTWKTNATEWDFFGMCLCLSAGRYGLLYHGSMLTKLPSFTESFINLSAMLQYLAFAVVQTYVWPKCGRHSSFESFCKKFHKHCLKCWLVSSPKVGFLVAMVSNIKAIQKLVSKRLLKLQRKGIIKREKFFFLLYLLFFPTFLLCIRLKTWCLNVD